MKQLKKKIVFSTIQNRILQNTLNPSPFEWLGAQQINIVNLSVRTLLQIHARYADHMAEYMAIGDMALGNIRSEIHANWKL